MAPAEQKTFPPARSAPCTPRFGERRSERPDPLAFEGNTARYYDAFLHESDLDDIAFTSRIDPLAMRRKLMASYPVATTVIDAVERMSGWKTPAPKGIARGFAFTLSSGIWVAVVIQISEGQSGIHVEKVFCATNSAFIQDQVDFRARITGKISDGLSAAIGHKIAAANGAPEIEVEMISHSTRPAIEREPTPPVIPALANAVFALTGKRVRAIPLAQDITFV